MNIQPTNAQHGDLTPEEDPSFDPPFAVVSPEAWTLPIVFASPHSGRDYPAHFLAASRLDLLSIRRSEDSFVNELFQDAAQLGAPLIHALFPRAYLDPNREPYELDPGMFEDALPAYANTRSLRVAGGLGTVARVVTDGAEIYRTKMAFSEAERRIETLYLPYHRQLRRLLDEARAKFGFAVLIDCHSMPSIGGPMDEDRGHDRADMVLGDRFGTSCSPTLTQAVDTALSDMGYAVARNNPYAGGYTTDHYGRPIQGVHALQIELNRALYMDEHSLTRTENFAKVRADMRNLAQKLADISDSLLSVCL